MSAQNRFRTTLAELVTHDGGGNEIQFITIDGGGAVGGNFALVANTAKEITFLADCGVILESDQLTYYNIAFNDRDTITVPAATVTVGNRAFKADSRTPFFVKKGSKMSLISGDAANVNITLAEYRDGRDLA